MVNIKDMTKLQQDILAEMSRKSGKELNQRRLAKLLGVSEPAIMKSLPRLSEAELIRTYQDPESRRWSISLNTGNRKVKPLKRVYNLQQIYETGLYEELERIFPGTTIILFGSYSRGEDTIDSDIDIAIVDSKSRDVNLAEYESKLERTINISFFTSWKKIDKHLKENLCNGIILQGGVEL